MHNWYFSETNQSLNYCKIKKFAAVLFILMIQLAVVGN